MDNEVNANLNNNINQSNNNHNAQNNHNANEEEKVPMHDIDLSCLMFIKNPNNEMAIGYAEAKLPTENLNTSGSEKQVTHQHYGTIPIGNIESRSYRVYTFQEYTELKIHSLIIRYVVLLLSLIMITLDLKTIRNRIASQDEIISELRTIHIQMDDVQLYQIFWSFLIVYIASLVLYCFCVILSIIYDSMQVIKYTFRLLMFTVIYQIIEIVMRRYDFLLIFLRVVLILLVKIWINLNFEISIALEFHPEYRVFSWNIFNRRSNAA